MEFARHSTIPITLVSPVTKATRLGLSLCLVTCSLSLALQPAQAESPTKAAQITSDSVNATGISAALKKIAAALKKKGITKIPSTSTLIASSSSASSKAVSGTPPNLVQISALSTIKDLFWLPGVVDGIANNKAGPPQCRQFFAGKQDGSSGGFGACKMAEDVGHAFQNLLNSETSLCFMRNLPTKANVKAGAIKILKGTPPSSDITKLFATGAKKRVVKIRAKPIGGQGPAENIFISIPSSQQNTRKNLSYSSTLYFCPADKPGAARGFNTLTVSTSGLVKLTIGNTQDPFGGSEANLLSVQGFLALDSSDIAWDTSKSRTTSLSVVGSKQNFKADVVITSDNLIYQKLFDTKDNKISKNYSISEFSGSNITDIGFLQGAFMDRRTQGELDEVFTSATEYRDSRYLAAPNNSLTSLLSSYSMDTDSFFATEPVVSVDVSGFSCNAKADIEIAMVENNATLESALDDCFRKELDNVRFCKRDEVVTQALEQFRNSCPMRQN